MPESAGSHTVGVLVQTNFGGVLAMDGVPVGEELGTHVFADAAEEARARTESGSCMIVVAFSTAPSQRIPHPGLQAPAPVLAPATLTALFQAAAEATEEAILDSLLKATTARGFRGRESRALPLEELERVFAKHGRALGPRPAP